MRRRRARARPRIANATEPAVAPVPALRTRFEPSRAAAQEAARARAAEQLEPESSPLTRFERYRQQARRAQDRGRRPS